MAGASERVRASRSGSGRKSSWADAIGGGRSFRGCGEPSAIDMPSTAHGLPWGRCPDGRRPGSGAIPAAAFNPERRGGAASRRCVDKTSEPFNAAASRSIPGRAGFDYLVVGAGFAGSVLAERLAAASASGCWSSTSARTSAAMPTTATTRPACSMHPYGPHIFHTNRPRSSSTCRASRVAAVSASGAGQRRRAAGADADQSRHRQPSLRPGTHALRHGGWLAAVAEPKRADRDLRGRRRQQGRPRPLQEVLPRLHAQAVGPRSVGARCQRDGARADAHQPRRPLFHRHLPGDAAARLHPHVRERCCGIRTSR